LEGLVTVVNKPLFGGVYEGRRVFVTGHTGFKGSWLTRWLLDLGAHVTGYALEPPTEPALFDALGLASRIDHNIGDVRDLAHLREVMVAAKPEIVLHLAAQPLVRLSYDEPVSTFETNVMGSVNVLEAARSVDSVRTLLNVTSDKCYENREWEFAYRENDAMGGYDPYSASKGCAELVTAAYRQSFFGVGSRVAVASARAGNVIGGGDWALDRIVPDCVRALSAGESIIVRNPDAVRPWQHVLEPTSGYLWLASRLFVGAHDYDGAWNFGPAASGNITVREVVETVLAEWGSGEWTGPEVGTHNPHEAHFLKLDCSKAADLLAWRGVWDARLALRYTTSWYRDFYAGKDAETLSADCTAAYSAAATRAGIAWTL
jgi:CDP-glucose 4,6-dehydratase